MVGTVHLQVVRSGTTNEKRGASPIRYAAETHRLGLQTALRIRPSRDGLGDVPFKERGKLVRPTQRRAVTALDLIRVDPKAIANQWPEPPRGEESVVAAQDEASWDFGPGREGPGLAAWRVGLPSFVRERLIRKV
jgi:hypothetical protein